MSLNIRPKPYIIPSYSLTSDILMFMRCGLQYRYRALGKLPPSRPVQLWFGQFIHGVMEEAFREYKQGQDKGIQDLPPWPEEQVRDIMEEIKNRLAAQKLVPWGERVQEIGEAIAMRAVNELAPLLFPLISKAEIKLTGTRPLPYKYIKESALFREESLYEISGVIDVLTNIEVNNPSHKDNQLVGLIIGSIKVESSEDFEIIIDYKGMRRDSNYGGNGVLIKWDVYNWQLQTYANLRKAQPESMQVKAGVIIYLNELYPTSGDLEKLKIEINEDRTDIVPDPNTRDLELIRNWNKKKDVPELSFEFRLRRAVRIIPIDIETIHKSLDMFDRVVGRIETCRGMEMSNGSIIDHWEMNPEDYDTCNACEARTFCPSFKKETEPRLPAVK